MNESYMNQLQKRLELLRVFSCEDVAVDAARALNKAEKESTYAVFVLDGQTELQFIVAEATDWECLARLGYQMTNHRLYD